MKIIKYIAETDLSFKEGFKLGGDGNDKLVPYNDDDTEEVPKGKKKLFFYANLMGSLMSLILGIVILYLVSENIQAFNVEYDIVIEPKMSFGTGHHETTHMMIQHILATDFTNKSVLDISRPTSSSPP